ncbi:MAG: alpha/beta hydrolase [Hyphomicrobiales bacterium]|nr:alpha/beta hydrolase [Hyphomicrobiales bacterium]
MPDANTENDAASPIWRGMDRATLDAAYNNLEAVPGSEEIIGGWAERSLAVRDDPRARLDIPYGERERMKLDCFPASDSNSPLFAFIHGGYWKTREKESFAVFAEGPRAHGISFASIGYTLAPEARLRTIVEEIRQALTFLAGHADDLGFDPTRIFVGGWSAGGHLATMMLDHPAIKGALSISGLYELEPIALCYVNEGLKLDDAEVADLSPLRHVNQGLAPIRLVAGADELTGVRGQAEDYAAAAEKAGMSVSFRLLDGHNHFTIMEELESPSDAITQELVALVEGR